ncbi:hypothetical protein [Propionibacterium sp. oral taxon 192]|nr:hypothetical protein [Propionibacterium sp. oral taxon 192]
MHIGQIEWSQRDLSLHKIVRIADGLKNDPEELVQRLREVTWMT